MTAGRQATLRQRLFTIAIAGVGAAAASAASFAMAVYEAANPEPLRVTSAGQPIDTGRWSVTIRKALRGPVSPTDAGTAEPKPVVVVEMDVKNLSAVSSYVPANLFKLEGRVPDLPEPKIFLARDNSMADPLNPGMPERLAVAWEWPRDVEFPARLRVVMNGQIYKRRDNLYGASGWFDGDPVAAIDLPVSNSRDAKR